MVGGGDAVAGRRRGDLKPCSSTAPQCLMPPFPSLLVPPIARPSAGISFST